MSEPLGEGHTYHECPICGPPPDDLITELSEVEHERLVKALYSSKFGEYGYFGRPECEAIVHAMQQQVVRIKVNAFHAGMRWDGPVHEALVERNRAIEQRDQAAEEAVKRHQRVMELQAALNTLRTQIFRLGKSIFNGAPDPLQDYYNRGFGQWLQNEIDKILEGRSDR